MCHYNLCDLPLSVPGKTSYRCMTLHGWLKVAADSPQDALQTAARFSRYPHSLQVWNGRSWTPCEALGQ